MVYHCTLPLWVTRAIRAVPSRAVTEEGENGIDRNINELPRGTTLALRVGMD